MEDAASKIEKLPANKKTHCEPYEIEIIGRFIAGLAAYAALNAEDEETAVGLYQQSPNDSIFGDMIASHSGRFFAIEFKRSLTVSSVRSELHKWRCHEAGFFFKKALPLGVASKCHFVVHGSKKRACGASFFPFSNLFANKEDKIAGGSGSALVWRIVKGLKGIGVDFNTFSMYIMQTVRLRKYGWLYLSMARTQEYLRSASARTQTAKAEASFAEELHQNFFNLLANALSESGYPDVSETLRKAAREFLATKDIRVLDFLQEWRLTDCETNFLAISFEKKGRVGFSSMAALLAYIVRHPQP